MLQSLDGSPPDSPNMTRHIMTPGTGAAVNLEFPLASESVGAQPILGSYYSLCRYGYWVCYYLTSLVLS